MQKSHLSSAQKRTYSHQVGRLRQQFTTGFCRYPHSTCRLAPIRSHTISRAKYLQQIAEDNKVGQLKIDQWADNILESTNCKLVYANEATTFPGFCSVHDAMLFQCIDDLDFCATREQLFMIAYRNHSREVHCKSAQVKSSPKPEDWEAIWGEAANKDKVDFMEAHLWSSNIGLRDGMFHHGQLVDQLTCKDFSRLVTCVVPFAFSGNPFIATAGSFFPDFDLAGTPIQDFSDPDAILNVLHYTILPGEEHSFAVFSYLDIEQSGPKQFIDSLISSPRSADLLVWLAFCYIENTVLRPSWWHGQNEPQRREIISAFAEAADLGSPLFANIARCPESFVTEITVGREFWI